MKKFLWMIIFISGIYACGIDTVLNKRTARSTHASSDAVSYCNSESRVNMLSLERLFARRVEKVPAPATCCVMPDTIMNDRTCFLYEKN